VQHSSVSFIALEAEQAQVEQLTSPDDWTVAKSLATAVVPLTDRADALRNRPSRNLWDPRGTMRRRIAHVITFDVVVEVSSRIRTGVFAAEPLTTDGCCSRAPIWHYR
jgi:hypothetical protein